MPKPSAEAYASALSLYRAGRHSDALKAFEALRTADSDPAFPAWIKRLQNILNS